MAVTWAVQKGPCHRCLLPAAVQLSKLPLVPVLLLRTRIRCSSPWQSESITGKVCLHHDHGKAVLQPGYAAWVVAL